jgi:predicted RNase H-like HicB family nuclease
MGRISARNIMKVYHVSIEQSEGWFTGRVLDRDGITTQGRTLDELIFMVRDAIKLMWNESNVQLELSVPNKVGVSFTPRVKGKVA